MTQSPNALSWPKLRPSPLVPISLTTTTNTKLSFRACSNEAQTGAIFSQANAHRTTSQNRAGQKAPWLEFVFCDHSSESGTTVRRFCSIVLFTTTDSVLSKTVRQSHKAREVPLAKFVSCVTRIWVMMGHEMHRTVCARSRQARMELLPLYGRLGVPRPP